MIDLPNYFDARLLTEFNPDTPQYQSPLAFTMGKNAKADHWESAKPIPHVRALFDILAHHPEAKAKDGLAFVCGEMIPGPRNKTAMKAMYAFGYDFDGGTDPNVIDAGFLKLGCAFLRYTSFSNGKATSDFGRDAVAKFLKCGKSAIDSSAMQRFAREKEGWAEEIAATVELIEVKQVSGGFKCFVSHAPLHKNRVIVPLAAPFVIDDYENLQEATAKWNAIYFGVADKIELLEQIDRTGADLNRLFYFPRHPKDGQHETVIAGGDVLDWRTLELENPLDVAINEIVRSSGGGKSVTPEGKALASWSREHADRFQIAELLREHCDDRIREDKSDKVVIECPNDAAHSNAGDSGDAACIAVNAGDGLAPVFVVSCRHASCQGLTNLDMLGLMLESKWFPREVIESDDYNAIGDGDTEQPQPEADYQAAIRDLTPNATDAQIESAISLCIEAKPSVRALENALKGIGEKTGTSIQTLRKMFKSVKGKKREQAGIVIAGGYGGALAFDTDMAALPNGVSYDKESGQVHSTYRNALLLIGSEHWDLGYNVLSQTYGLRGEVEYPWPDHLGYALNDSIRREIRLYMLRRWGVTFKTEDIYEATMTLARRNTFNPVSDYLNEVEQQWDGTPRVDTWLEKYMGVKVTDENCAYVRAIGKIVLVAAVRRARQPGCKFDEMLILESPQGGGKSTAVGILGGDWFSDANLGDLSKKEARMKLRDVWLQENAELAGLNRAEVNELKEFMSQRVDRYRLPYAKSEEDFPRRCIFIGTVNPGGGAYLTDLTGNRRFWPVACGDIDLDALARDRDQIWAEAAMMESRGDAIRLDPSLYGAAKAEQDARLADDPWREILIEHLDGVNPTKEGTPRVTSNVLLTVALEIPKDRLTQPHMKRLKGVMATIPNWKYKESVRVDGERTAGYEYAGA